MADIVFVLVFVVVLCFGFVVIFGAPYVPTMKPQIKAAFDLLDLQPGQHLLELGCGDGKVLIAAAERGIAATGYELNPILFLISWLRTRRYHKLVSVRLTDFWKADWPPADGIFAFILPKLMHKVDMKILVERRGPIRLVSFAFAIPDKKIERETSGVFLYIYK